MGRRFTAHECNSSKDYWKRRHMQLFDRRRLPRDLTPLRYPGGKGSLKYFLSNIVSENKLVGGELVEPFCGGAGASLPLLETNIISRLHLNDANPAVAAFWHCVFFETDSLISLIKSTPVTIYQWHRWKEVVCAHDQASTLELGFAAFFMNRCNRSGLLYGGPIGGLKQTGKYKIDCRFNREGLIDRISVISRHASRVTVSNMDACDYLNKLDKAVAKNSIIFLDPPYVNQGANLYKRYSFNADKHNELANFIKPKKWKWVITYDDHPLIHELYAERARGVLEFSYLMQQAKIGRELLVASSHCRIPMPSQLTNEGSAIDDPAYLAQT